MVPPRTATVLGHRRRNGSGEGSVKGILIMAEGARPVWGGEDTHPSGGWHRPDEAVAAAAAAAAPGIRPGAAVGRFHHTKDPADRERV